jgi:DNA polymerase-3 subunit delta'
MPETDAAEVVSPKPFSDIVGQERAIEYIKKVLKGGKVSHAYLFVGINGVGKTTTALAMTRALNCLEPLDEGEGCGSCVHCRQMAGGNFPDFESLSPHGRAIRIEQIRELNRRISLKTVSGRYRVVVVERAELMTKEAANAFLKTLEEPPEGNVLILTVADQQDLLPTILSRCQRVPFQPISTDVLSQWLQAEKGASEEDSRVLSRISEGSIGRAVRMLESEFCRLRHKHFKAILGLRDCSGPEVLSLAIDYAQEEKKADNTGDVRDGGLYSIFGLWKSFLRDMLVIKSMGAGGLLVHEDYEGTLQKASNDYNISGLTESLLVLDRAQRELLRSRNMDLMMETTLLSLKRLQISN